MLADDCIAALAGLGQVFFGPLAIDFGALPDEFLRVDSVASEPIGQTITAGCPSDRETTQVTAWATTRTSSTALARAAQNALNSVGIEHIRGVLVRWDNEARMYGASFDISSITLRPQI